MLCSLRRALQYKSDVHSTCREIASSDYCYLLAEGHRNRQEKYDNCYNAMIGYDMISIQSWVSLKGNVFQNCSIHVDAMIVGLNETKISNFFSPLIKSDVEKNIFSF